MLRRWIACVVLLGALGSGGPALASLGADAVPATGPGAWRAAAGPRLAVPIELVEAGVVAAQARTAEIARARRRAEARRLAGTRTVRGALRRAWLLDVIDRAHHDRYRRAWRDAQALAARLPGRRRAELLAVLRTTAGIAGRRRLTPTRLRPVFLVLERNARFLARRPFPASGQRITFGRDPAVFEYRAGQGLVLHPLASWGRVNGVARACLANPGRCPRVRLRRDLDRLAGLASRRGGFIAWEYLHHYGRGAPPWVSGMAQGTAVQALARGARALGRPAYLRTARRALGVFAAAPPLGVSVRADGGHHFVMYSFDPGLRILNGFLQAVTGLHDLAVLGGGRRARALYRDGERAARAEVAAADTGAWSLYSERGRESTLSYHVLLQGFLENLCRRTSRGAYCAAGTRFARYEHEPPRIGVAPLGRPRAGRTTQIAFRLSKVSSVDVRMGPRLLAAGMLGRGRHVLRWTPPGRGRYRLAIAATGLGGPRGTLSRTVRVRPAPPTPAQRRQAAARRRAADRAARRRSARARHRPAARR